VVVFLHTKTDRSFTAEVKTDDGSYKAEGLLTGDYKIGVQPYNSPSVTGQGPMAQMAGGGGKGEKSMKGAEQIKDKDIIKPPDSMFGVFDKGSRQSFYIPPKYMQPNDSGLTVTVNGGKQTYDITVPDQ